MASGSGGGNGGGRRKGAQSRLTYKQLQTSRSNKGRVVRRMKLRRVDASIPF